MTMIAGAKDRLRFRATDRARRAIDRVQDLAPDRAGRIFTRFDAGGIARAAEAADTLAERGAPLPLHGLTISIKDLFDEEGAVTSAGSAYFQTRAPATADAPAVARLVVAGAVPFGRTNMSEFAYSGVGLNPHFGTPGNAADATRIPGGSSSGAGVAAGLGLCAASLGSDTGGSIRIPAALNGIAGFKPSQQAVPTAGAFPLAESLDGVGPLAPDIATCAALHAVLSETTGALRPEDGVSGLRIGIVTTIMTDDLDTGVAADFDRARAALDAAGARFVAVDMAFLDHVPALNRLFVWAEAHAVHEAYLDRLDGVSDPHVLRRLRFGRDKPAAEVAAAISGRREMMAAWAASFADVDVLIAPTVASVAPTIADAEADFDRINALMLRNTSLGNYCDCCAATLPMQSPGALPTGLMVMGANGADWAVLDAASRIEAVLDRAR